jgi:hypothetical protein
MNTEAKLYLSLQVAEGWVFNNCLEGWLNSRGIYYPNTDSSGFNILHTRNAHRIEPKELKGLPREFDYPSTGTCDLYQKMYELGYLQ